MEKHEEGLLRAAIATCGVIMPDYARMRKGCAVPQLPHVEWLCPTLPALPAQFVRVGGGGEDWENCQDRSLQVLHIHLLLYP